MSTINTPCDLALDAVKALLPYQPGKPIDELERELGLTNIVKLASNENPLGPSLLVKQAIEKSIDEVSLYPDGNGFALKQALANKHGITSEMITLGNGSNDVLDIIARVFLSEGREAIFSEYAFVVYAIATQAVNATARVAKAKPLGGDDAYGHDLATMAELLTDKTTVIFIANPNNPTGTWLDPAELETFIASVPKHIVVVLDEAYCEYLQPETAFDSMQWLAHFPNLIITRTFSKAYGLAGLRVGYAVSQPAVADLLNRIRQPFNVNSIALAAAEAALSDQAYIEQSRELNQQGLQQLADGFDRLGLAYIPSVGNFICVEVGDNSTDVYQGLLKQGVIVRPVAAYNMPRHLRVSVGLAEQNIALLEALEKVLPGV
ncbi:histidinol-phosphate transaminase [Cycloclasticus sp. 46_83_sub15_T18]|nr:histidinol-phosphate transaminase [Cycloclasticus sp. 46_83_sub15_T18]